MTREEVQTLLTRLFTLYPLSFSKLTQAEKSVTVDSWLLFLEEFDTKAIYEATRIAILSNNSGFAPTVGEIIDKLGTVAEFKQISEPEAWDMVIKAIRNSNHAREYFDKFPDEVKDVVRSPSQLCSWGMTDSKMIETSVRKTFREAYNKACERAKKYGKLPENVKQLIHGVEQEPRIEQREYDFDKLEKEMLGG